MTKRLRILVTAAEALPFVGGGGLAESVGGLSQALADRGHRVDVLLPHVPAVTRLPPSAGPVQEVGAFEVLVGARLLPARISCPAGDHGVRPLLLSIPELFDREGVYGPTPGTTFADNVRRFKALSRASLMAHAVLRQKYDILHAHDWPVGPAAYLAREMKLAGGMVARASVFTMYNAGYQGNFWALDLPQLGLGPEHYTLERLEFFGSVSFLKAGLVSADRVTTVSPSYAREVISAEGGQRMDGPLRARGKDFSGILHGVDHARWNPATDEALSNRYTDPTSPERRRCVQAFRAGAQLADSAAPVFGYVGELGNERGGDVLTASIDELVAAGGMLAMIVPPHDALLATAQKAAAKHPEKVAVMAGTDERDVRRLLAGSDFFLVPSRVEPCHLLQMAAMRYGAVSVVRRTGSLRDTVLDITASPTHGTGLGYIGDGVPPLMGVIRRALTLWADQNAYQHVQQQATQVDHSMAATATAYEALYNEALNGAAPSATT